MQETLEEESSATSIGELFKGKNARALSIGCGIVLLQQLTGQPSVLYYATTVFKYAGFGSSASLQPVLVGIAKLLFTLGSAFTVDRLGRKRLLYIGISMMLVALIALAISFSQRYCTLDVPLDQCATDDVALPSSYGTLAIISLMAYVSGYQIGFGPIAWLLISELFPLRARGRALSVAASTNFLSNILVTITFKYLLDALTPSGAFGLYGALCIVSLIFVKARVFETKGLTLEEIEQKL